MNNSNGEYSETIFTHTYSLMLDKSMLEINEQIYFCFL